MPDAEPCWALNQGFLLQSDWLGRPAGRRPNAGAVGRWRQIQSAHHPVGWTSRRFALLSRPRTIRSLRSTCARRHFRSRNSIHLHLGRGVRPFLFIVSTDVPLLPSLPRDQACEELKASFENCFHVAVQLVGVDQPDILRHFALHLLEHIVLSKCVFVSRRVPTDFSIGLSLTLSH